MKTCSKCKVELEEWRRANYCRDCAREYARRRREANPDKARDADRRRRATETPEQRERRLERGRKAYAAKRAERAKGRICDECGEAIPLEANLASVTCSETCARQRRLRLLRKYYEDHRGPRVQGTAESGERMSKLRREWWATVRRFKDKPCRGCGETFTPSCGPQAYCSPECKALWRDAARYGLTGDELKALVAAHDGRCDLCGGRPTEYQRGAGFHIDHCHATGKVRGFLCLKCNTGLGKLNDDPALLERGAAYLRGELDGR